MSALLLSLETTREFIKLKQLDEIRIEGIAIDDSCVDEQLYPASFFCDLETRDYRVVLSLTSMVNGTNKDTRYTDGARKRNPFSTKRAATETSRQPARFSQ